ncbi:hypothetical protein LDENG_00126010 [Lucifuga dentata]|nr:hypothetical protein LDENG_00126010 [Lucifuga dentata]
MGIKSKRHSRGNITIYKAMASACSFMSEEQFLCSICLDVFTEPVSTPCGHNFCKSCITRHWESSELCQCPLCNEKFHKGHKLRVNTGFRDVVENFKKLNLIARNMSPVQPGEVPCDCCSGTKLKAFKSCLVCLASYCETHLEPHQRVTALKRHKLTDPVQNLEDRVCKKHDKILELFCKKDQICVCVMCKEHKKHDTVPLEEAYEEKKTQLVKKKSEMKKMIQERQQNVQKIKASVQSKREDTDEATAKIVELFTVLMSSIQRNTSELIELIEEKQRAAERQDEDLIKELEEEITELQRRSTELVSFSNTQDHLYFLQNFSCSSSSPHTKNWSHTTTCSHLCVCEEVSRATVQLKEILTNMMEWRIGQLKVCADKSTNEETSIMKKPTDVVSHLENLPEVTKLKIIQQQYAVHMTFDPNSANDWLLCSQDMKEVQPGFICFCENPKRFDRFVHILGNKGFSTGRFYYEVQVKNKTGWDLGTVRESVGRKKKFTMTPKNGTWIIRLRKENKYQALLESHGHLPLRNKPDRVGVFVDYEGGLVSFYDVDAAALIFSFTGCNFREKIFPFFSPGPAEGGRNCVPLIITPVKITTNKSTWAAVYDYLYIIFTIFALFWIWFQ